MMRDKNNKRLNIGDWVLAQVIEDTSGFGSKNVYANFVETPALGQIEFVYDNHRRPYIEIVLDDGDRRRGYQFYPNECVRLPKNKKRREAILMLLKLEGKIK